MHYICILLTNRPHCSFKTWAQPYWHLSRSTDPSESCREMECTSPSLWGGGLSRRGQRTAECLLCTHHRSWGLWLRIWVLLALRWLDMSKKAGKTVSTWVTSYLHCRICKFDKYWLDDEGEGNCFFHWPFFNCCVFHDLLLVRMIV